MQDLHENMALGLERPLRLEYYGPLAMNEVGMYPRTLAFFPPDQITEAELIKRANMAILLNGIHSAH